MEPNPPRFARFSNDWLMQDLLLVSVCAVVFVLCFSGIPFWLVFVRDTKRQPTHFGDSSWEAHAGNFGASWVCFEW